MKTYSKYMKSSKHILIIIEKLKTFYSFETFFFDKCNHKIRQVWKNFYKTSTVTIIGNVMSILLNIQKIQHRTSYEIFETSKTSKISQTFETCEIFNKL